MTTTITYIVGLGATYALIEYSDPTGIFEQEMVAYGSAHPDDLWLDIPETPGIWMWSGLLKMSGEPDNEAVYIGKWTRVGDIEACLAESGEVGK